LNKKIFLQEKNIDKIENIVKYSMEILGEWKQSHLSRQPKEGHKVEESDIEPLTQKVWEK
jgi:hypothetical protein